MIRIHPILIGVLLGFVCRVGAEDGVSHFYSLDDKGQIVWSITDYLKGTTPKICDLLFSETERLSVVEAKSERRIAELQTEISEEKKSAISRIRASKEYKNLVTERDAAQDAHDSATGSSARIEASRRYNKARAAIAALEKTAADTPVAQITQDREFLHTAENDLQSHHAALLKATAWRDKLIGCIHNSFAMQWPLERGATGSFGTVTVKAVVSNNIVEVEYDAPEAISTKDSGEGLATIQYIPHPTRIAVIETNHPAAGSIMRLDHSYRIVKSIEVGDDEIYLAARDPSPLNPINRLADAMEKRLIHPNAPSTQP